MRVRRAALATRSLWTSSRSAARLDEVNPVRRHKMGGLEVATRRSADAIAIAMREKQRSRSGQLQARGLLVSSEAAALGRIEIEVHPLRAD
jgi:hypothetical protein